MWAFFHLPFLGYKLQKSSEEEFFLPSTEKFLEYFSSQQENKTLNLKTPTCPNIS